MRLALDIGDTSTAEELTRVESKSDLQIRLVRQLLKMITDGALEAGARLLEIELSQQFGVSRTPLRAALAQLSSLGVIEKRDGGGQYVSTAA
jgi:DNA-binding GntR family transcriptional regulator